MKKLLSSSKKVRFQDCDPFNHLNNAKYIDYLINAREDHLLDNYGFDIFKIAGQQGLSWVIASNQICYLKPAVTMETVVINSCLFSYSAKSLWVEMQMWNQEHSHLKALLWTNFIHFDLQSQKPANHSAELSRLFAEIVSPFAQTAFDERRNFLVRESKVG